jgi:hypothetical protein
VQDSSVVAFKLGDPRRTSSNPGEVFFLLLSLEKKYTYMCALYCTVCTVQRIKCPEPARADSSGLEPARVGSGRLGKAKSPF